MDLKVLNAKKGESTYSDIFDRLATSNFNIFWEINPTIKIQKIGNKIIKNCINHILDLNN